MVNDGGVDVMEIIGPLNNEGKIICLHHKDNKGRSAARNTGLKTARGKYIAYLDDYFIHKCIQKCFQLITDLWIQSGLSARCQISG